MHRTGWEGEGAVAEGGGQKKESTRGRAIREMGKEKGERGERGGGREKKGHKGKTR